MGLNSNWPFHWITGHPPSGRHRVTCESTLEAAHLLPLWNEMVIKTTWKVVMSSTHAREGDFVEGQRASGSSCCQVFARQSNFDGRLSQYYHLRFRQVKTHCERNLHVCICGGCLRQDINTNADPLFTIGDSSKFVLMKGGQFSLCWNANAHPSWSIEQIEDDRSQKKRREPTSSERKTMSTINVSLVTGRCCIAF